MSGHDFGCMKDTDHRGPCALPASTHKGAEPSEPDEQDDNRCPSEIARGTQCARDKGHGSNHAHGSIVWTDTEANPPAPAPTTLSDALDALVREASHVALDAHSFGSSDSSPLAAARQRVEKLVAEMQAKPVLSLNLSDLECGYCGDGHGNGNCDELKAHVNNLAAEVERAFKPTAGMVKTLRSCAAVYESGYHEPERTFLRLLAAEMESAIAAALRAPVSSGQPLGELLDALTNALGGQTHMDAFHEPDCLGNDDLHKPCECGANAPFLAARRAIEQHVEGLRESEP